MLYEVNLYLPSFKFSPHEKSFDIEMQVLAASKGLAKLTTGKCVCLTGQDLQKVESTAAAAVKSFTQMYICS